MKKAVSAMALVGVAITLLGLWGLRHRGERRGATEGTS